MNRGYPTPATVTRSSQAPEMVTGNARHSQLQFQQPYTHSPPTRGLQLQLPNPSSRQHQMFSRSNEYRSPPMHSQYSVPPPPQAQQAPLPPPQQQSVNHGHYSSHHYNQQQQQQQQQYQQQQLPPATENTEHQWYRSQPEYQRHQYGNGPASPIHHASRPAY
ncbi:hypothetical protein FBU59_005902 [Linderina macrospora]|uniref:Uncharacterized protein n=1 Tax=Linderina macrospora TaxID=4868 RepID=A0ACC1J1B1_9FUNG|nr:hypothetical protein FBU59_005902 [Linderina macrospora]